MTLCLCEGEREREGDRNRERHTEEHIQRKRQNFLSWLLIVHVRNQ